MNVVTEMELRYRHNRLDNAFPFTGITLCLSRKLRLKQFLQVGGTHTSIRTSDNKATSKNKDVMECFLYVSRVLVSLSDLCQIIKMVGFGRLRRRANMAERMAAILKCFTTRTIANQELPVLKQPYRWDCFLKQHVLVIYEQYLRFYADNENVSLSMVVVYSI